ncbi:unnamed protein product [Taenia asiatica]|uniref:RUN domain-containing protein n=1 Tax=Taenia asiatica TaxID=60517 RepID=A0A0R3W9X4_TAEAS|nr:unnamed protein product [Taenia asiatica]
MDGVPSLEELMECNSYVRERFLSCQNRLFVILWGSFQKAISELARLYRDKLDNRCDNQCLIQALFRIESFYQCKYLDHSLCDQWFTLLTYICAGNWRSFLSAKVSGRVDTLEFIVPSVDELPLSLSPNRPIIISRRKRRAGFVEDYHPYSTFSWSLPHLLLFSFPAGLIDSMSKFCLHSNSKLQRLESVIDTDIREDLSE